MEKIKIYFPFLAVIAIILGISYYNYSGRLRFLNVIRNYQSSRNLVTIWSNKMLHYNVFDWWLEDATDFNFMFIDTSHISYDDPENYNVFVQKWIEPSDLETKFNLSYTRSGDNYYIISYDLFWIEEYKDTLVHPAEIETIFGVADKWIAKNKSNK